MALIWSEKYLLGIEEIDSQHRIFVGLMEKLVDAFNNKKEKVEMEKIYRELFDYVKYHFGTEEKYFKKFNFKGMAVHMAEHQSFREIIYEMYVAAMKDKYIGTVELTTFMYEWLVNHTAKMDKMYAKLFRENGVV